MRDRIDETIATVLRHVAPLPGFETRLLARLAAGFPLPVHSWGQAEPAPHNHGLWVAGSVAGALGAGFACWGIFRRHRKRAA